MSKTSGLAPPAGNFSLQAGNQLCGSIANPFYFDIRVRLLKRAHRHLRIFGWLAGVERQSGFRESVPLMKASNAAASAIFLLMVSSPWFSL
jgi:hypothetical protein